MQDDCENFVRFAFRNERFWCGECAHILILGQMIMILFASLLGSKFCHAPPFCVANCNGQIYYVVHRFQSMSRIVIHLGVHNHPITNGKCQESIEETRRLIIGEVDPTLDVKIFLISLSARKTFFVSYLFDHSTDGIVELLKGD